MTPGPAAPLRTEVLTRLDPVEVDRVALLIERVTEADGVRPLSEHVMLHLRYGGDYDVRHVLVWADEPTGEELAGYGHLDVTDPVEGPSAELAVSPRYRRRHVGRRIVETLLGETSDGAMRLWAHGEQAASGRLARAMGFQRTRVLWQMRRSLYAPLPRPALPPGVSLRTFEVGRDEAEWVRLNARAFVELPDQGGWTEQDLCRRMQEPWFDPHGFLVAERDGRMVGFHWTKVHGGEVHVHGDGGADDPPHVHLEHGHEPIGEVYVVGVDPDEQGHGLGRALTVAGLQHLRGIGLPAAMLYVDATNIPAIRVYEGLGFTRWDTDVLYRR
ncbi:MAG: mycothiol synthase [Candidatus Nanopelagicales bacterium]